MYTVLAQRPTKLPFTPSAIDSISAEEANQKRKQKQLFGAIAHDTPARRGEYAMTYCMVGIRIPCDINPSIVDRDLQFARF